MHRFTFFGLIMSTIKTTFNVIDKSWSQVEEFMNDSHIDLQFNAIGGMDQNNIDNLSFGYKFSQSGEIITQGNFPTVGTLEFIKETPFTNNIVGISRNSTYQLYVWAENFGDRIDNTFEIQVPPPLQPYPSWSWNGTEWVSPVPMPTDGPVDAAYKWSEKQSKWFLLVPPLTDFDDI
jgi:hypothetical protein